MQSDALAPLKQLLRAAQNTVEKLEPEEHTTNVVTGLGGGGGGQRLGGTFGGGGMDPWQHSVESRLSSLDGRAGRIEETLSAVRSDLSSVKTKVDDLPSKWFIVTAVSAIGAAALIVAQLVRLAF